MSVVRLLDNGTVVTGYAVTFVSTAWIGIDKFDATNYTPSTNNTSVWGQITFEVAP